MSHGICFAFAIIGGSIDRDRVYVWYPIGDIRTLLAPSLRAFSDLGEQPGIADGLEAAAAVGAATGQPLEAGRLLEAASMLRECIGIAPLAYLRAIWQPWIVRAEEQIGAEHWTAARLEGRALSLEAAVARAVDAQP